LFVSPFADPNPDGLNRVAIEKGFADREKQHGLAGSPVAGYSVKGVRNEGISTGLSGMIGATVTFMLAAGFFVLVRRRAARPDSGGREQGPD
jgi:cobalt/nickel transport system permease protein